MKSKTWIFVFGLLLIVLTACGDPINTPTPSPTVTAMPTPTPRPTPTTVCQPPETFTDNDSRLGYSWVVNKNNWKIYTGNILRYPLMTVRFLDYGNIVTDDSLFEGYSFNFQITSDGVVSQYLTNDKKIEISREDPHQMEVGKSDYVIPTALIKNSSDRIFAKNSQGEIGILYILVCSAQIFINEEHIK